jgi:hypothetical protein
MGFPGNTWASGFLFGFIAFLSTRVNLVPWFRSSLSHKGPCGHSLVTGSSTGRQWKL